MKIVLTDAALFYLCNFRTVNESATFAGDLQRYVSDRAASGWRCFQNKNPHVVRTVDHRQIVKISKVLMFIAAAFTKFGKLMSVILVFYRRQTAGYTELADRIPRN